MIPPGLPGFPGFAMSGFIFTIRLAKAWFVVPPVLLELAEPVLDSGYRGGG